MFRRYECCAYFIDDMIYKKNFKSINNALKVLAGFDNDICLEIEDLVTEKVMFNCEVRDLIRELMLDFEE